MVRTQIELIRQHILCVSWRQHNGISFTFPAKKPRCLLSSRQTLIRQTEQIAARESERERVKSSAYLNKRAPELERVEGAKEGSRGTQ